MPREVTAEQMERARQTIKNSPGQQRIWRDFQVFSGGDPNLPFEPAEDYVRMVAISVAAREAREHCQAELEAERKDLTRLCRVYDGAPPPARQHLAARLAPLLRARVVDLRRRTGIVSGINSSTGDEIVDLREDMAALEASIVHRS